MNQTCEPRAEQIIAEIYRQVVELREAGVEPTSVSLPYRYIRRLRIYKFLLGNLRSGPDYLENYRIFDLEFMVHDDEVITVN